MAELNAAIPRNIWHLTDIQTRVLLAVLAGHRFGGRIAEATGINRTSVWGALRRMSEYGLVTWDEGRHGTIRATVKMVNPHSSRP